MKSDVLPPRVNSPERDLQADSEATEVVADVPELVAALCKVEEPSPPTLRSVREPAGEVRITDPKTGGQKGRKPERFDLLPFDALEELARVYGFGAQKYEDDNWLRGYRWRLSLGALLRHVARWAIGEDQDRETGCHHLAHAAWHCLTLITFQMRSLGTDDRGKAERTEPT